MRAVAAWSGDNVGDVSSPDTDITIGAARRLCPVWLLARRHCARHQFKCVDSLHMRQPDQTTCDLRVDGVHRNCTPGLRRVVLAALVLYFENRRLPSAHQQIGRDVLARLLSVLVR